MPRVAKVIAVAVVAYALSPIDLIPDFIPVLGLIDDMVILPLGIWLVIRLIPDELWQQSLQGAQENLPDLRSARVAAVFIVGGWLLLVVWAVYQLPGLLMAA